MTTPQPAENEIQQWLDGAMERYLHDGLAGDDRIDMGGQIRGMAIALGVLRGTSAMDETLAAERRCKARP